MRRLINLAVFCLIPTLVGCQATQTTLSVISGNAACSRTEQQHVFPDDGAVAEIQFKLDIMGSEGPIEFNGIATCGYQGSMCGGGSWFQVWYGNQELHYSLSLPYDSTLEFRPHSFCIMIDEFRKACETGNCVPEEHFTFALQLGDTWTGDVPELSGKWGSMKSRRFSAGIHEISRFGFDVRNFDMELRGYLHKFSVNYK